MLPVSGINQSPPTQLSREEEVISILRKIFSLITLGDDVTGVDLLLDRLTPSEAFQIIPQQGSTLIGEAALYSRTNFIRLLIEKYGITYPQGFTQATSQGKKTPLIFTLAWKAEEATALLLPFYSLEDLQMKTTSDQIIFDHRIASSPNLQKLVETHTKKKLQQKKIQQTFSTICPALTRITVNQHKNESALCRAALHHLFEPRLLKLVGEFL